MTQQALSTISVQFKPVLPELVALNITQKKTIIVREKAAYKGGICLAGDPQIVTQKIGQILASTNLICGGGGFKIY